MADEWEWWTNALRGIRGELRRGDPKTGFYRDKSRAVAIWRDGGKLFCAVSSGYCPRHEDEIEDLFGFCSIYPIPHEVYLAVADRGEAWPPEYLVNLTVKEAQAGEVWTIEKARTKLARQNGLHATGAIHNQPSRAERATAAAIVEPDAAENERATIGGNNPPEPMTPDRDLAARITALETQAAEWLASIGGAPRDQIECDKVANYRELFLRLESEATSKHAAEKAPHLAAGKAVDAKWFPLRDDAENLKKQLRAIADAWTAAETTRLAEIARKENERLAEAARVENERRAALRASLAASPSAPARMPDLAPVVAQTVDAPKVTAGTMGRAIGTSRAPDVFVLTDIAKAAAFVATLPHGDKAFIAFLDGLQKAVNMLGRRKVAVPGVNEPKQEQAA